MICDKISVYFDIIGKKSQKSVGIPYGLQIP